MIANQTSINGVFFGAPKSLVDQFYLYNKNLNGTENISVFDLAALYVKWGAIFQIRTDIAWSQMEHETGFLKYPRQVKSWSNNYAGLGAIEGTGKFAIFETPELGVIAHLVHLAWYSKKEHMQNKYCNNTYDPRHFGVTHYNYVDGTLSTLNSKWAPNPAYTKNIIAYANKITVVSLPVPKTDLIIQMGHVGRTTGATGTAGEQVFNKAIGQALLLEFGNDPYEIHLMGADNWEKPEPNFANLFFAIHADGSLNTSARGCSVGYPVPSNPRFAQEIQSAYMLLSGFAKRPDNYTIGMKKYYAWSQNHVVANYYALLEHGFFTNPIERQWMTTHVNEIAKCHYNTIVKFLGGVFKN